MRLYQIEISPLCEKVRRILAYKRQPYEVKNLKLLELVTRLAQLGPLGGVPTLEDGGRVISDSSDIALYLEERFPDPPLVPRDLEERARCHVLEDWADESLYFYEARLRFTFAKNVTRTAAMLVENENRLMKRVGALVGPRAVQRILARQGIGRKPEEAVLRDVVRHTEAVAGLLGARDFLVGGALTLADISVFVELRSLRSTDEGEKILAGQPTVLQWMERVDAATAG